jgi:hypothetical protein
LYNLPPPQHGGHHHHQAPPPAFNAAVQKEANVFLTNIQSRNLARRVESVRRSQEHKQTTNKQTVVTQSQPQPQQTPGSVATGSRNDNSAQFKDDIQGSTWLACLTLLNMPDAHPAERIFCAQTLHHRSRRMCVEEAVDIEFEPWMTTTPQNGNQLRLDILYAWMEQNVTLKTSHQISPCLVHSMFPRGRPEAGQISHQSSKEEVSLLAVAGSLLFLTQQINNTHPTSIRQHTDLLHPLWTNLGAAMSLTAIRMTYTPQSVGLSNGPVDGMPPMVTLLQTALDTTAKTQVEAQNQQAQAEGQGQGPPSFSGTTMMQCLCAAVGELPDALLGCSGGARLKLSLDPRCIYAASAELRNTSAGVALLQQALLQSFSQIGGNHQPSDTATSDAESLVLWTIQRWALFLPLTMELTDGVLPLLTKHLDPSSPSNDGSKLQCRKASHALMLTIFEGGALSEEQIVALSAGLALGGSEGGGAASSHKPKGRAKKRRDKKLNALSTDDTVVHASQEAIARKQVAVHLAFTCLSPLQQSLRDSLHTLAQQHPGHEVDGEGSIGVACACAATCLPYLVQVHGAPDEGMTPSVSTLSVGHGFTLFESLMASLSLMTSSPNKNARRLAHDAIVAVHSAVVRQEQQGQQQDPRQGEIIAASVKGIFEVRVTPANYNRAKESVILVFGVITPCF